MGGKPKGFRSQRAQRKAQRAQGILNYNARRGKSAKGAESESRHRVASELTDLDDQIPRAIDREARVGRDDGGRAVFGDDGRAGVLLADAQEIACEDRGLYFLVVEMNGLKFGTRPVRGFCGSN